MQSFLQLHVFGFHVPPVKAPIDELRRLAMQQGMRTLMQDAIEKAFKGFSDIKQARAIAVK